MIFLLIAAALVAGTPLLAAVLVTIASLHEESVRSLSGRPPGRLTAAVRRLLAYSAGSPLSRRGLEGRVRNRAERGASPLDLPVPPSRKSEEDSFGDMLALPRR